MTAWRTTARTAAPGACPPSVDHRKGTGNPAGFGDGEGGPFESKYGEGWLEKLKGSTHMKMFALVTDMTDFINATTAAFYDDPEGQKVSPLHTPARVSRFIHWEGSTGEETCISNNKFLIYLTNRVLISVDV